MGSRSPSRFTIGDGNGSKSPVRESGLTEFDGGLPKSPMRDRFLSDLGSDPNSPVRSRNVSKSPMRERGPLGDFGFNGGGESRANSIDVSKSPMRERGRLGGFGFNGGGELRANSIDVRKSPMRERVGETPMSVRSRGINRSPMRENGTFVGEEQEGRGVGRFGTEEEEMRSVKMTSRASLNAWFPENKHSGQSKIAYSVRKGRTWRDQVAERAGPISEGRRSPSAYTDEYGMTSGGSLHDRFHGIDPSNERIHNDLRFRGEYVGGYANPRISIDQRVIGWDGSEFGIEQGRISVSSSNSDGPSNNGVESIYGYGGPRHNITSLRGPPSVWDLEVERAELLRKYRDLKDQLNNFDGKRFSSPQFYGGRDKYLEEDSIKFRRGYMHQYAPDKSVQRHHYLNPNMEDMCNLHPSLYDDPFCGQIAKVPRPKQPHYSMKNPIPSYVHSVNHERHCPRVYDHRMPQTTSQEQLSHSHLDHHYPRRVQVTTPSKRLCHPVSGGAPFVLCCGCFQLLKLPGKLIPMPKKDQHQLKCGACSCVMSFSLQKRSFHLLPSQKEPDSLDTVGDSGEVLKESGLKHQHDDTYDTTSKNNGSHDFDAQGYEVSVGPRLSSSSAENTKLSPSSPPSSLKEENISDNASVQSSRSNSAEMPLKINLVRPPPGSPLRDQHEYSSNVQSTEKDTFVESSTRSVSEDSEDEPREEDKVGDNEGGQSLARAEVYVNGRSISHEAVKSAEKFAGTIKPGHYWYDSEAGFWGVMGHPCLGIIPPSIPEFSFPMPVGCSGGDTGVYVNGRELHKRDLDVLASRGLPTIRNKSYIIDLSGKVFDGKTKRYFFNLGKLAPTVLKTGRGFGMQVPKKLID